MFYYFLDCAIDQFDLYIQERISWAMSRLQKNCLFLDTRCCKITIKSCTDYLLDILYVELVISDLGTIA